MNLKHVIEKIAKLRKQSEGEAAAGNLEASQNIAAIASRLAEKHRISEAELEAAGNAPTEQAEIADDPLFSETRAAQWKSWLAVVLCDHFGVARFLSRNRVTKKVGFQLVGRKSDIEVVRYFFAWLSADFLRIALKKSNGRGTVWCYSFLLGAVNGLKRQLDAARADERRAVRSTALVRLDSRLDEAKAALARAVPKLKSEKTRRRQIDAGAWRDGEEHGRSVHLGKGMAQSAASRALGGAS